jgi:hypothetical protein
MNSATVERTRDIPPSSHSLLQEPSETEVEGIQRSRQEHFRYRPRGGEGTQRVGPGGGGGMEMRNQQRSYPSRSSVDEDVIRGPSASSPYQGRDGKSIGNGSRLAEAPFRDSNIIEPPSPPPATGGPFNETRPVVQRRRARKHEPYVEMYDDSDESSVSDGKLLVKPHTTGDSLNDLNPVSDGNPFGKSKSKLSDFGIKLSPNNGGLTIGNESALCSTISRDNVSGTCARNALLLAQFGDKKHFNDNVLQSQRKPKERKASSILRKPRETFPEDPSPIREGVAPLKRMDGVPPDVRWTKIKRNLVSPEALQAGKERFEAREDFVIVLRVLSREEIQGYVEVTEQIRGKRFKN